MFRDFPLGCSWVFLLLLGSAVSRPASESDNKYPYAWGYGPRLLPDGLSGVQSDQQPNPGTEEPNDPPPGRSEDGGS
ncbi:unnamed protein product [Tetraodon nigroviridis]|uniref:(spotted green pufferfish) hypothetical protein n=1 Tax=Tetraodon nigroviridis TaxID=99883 RepID=Q4RF74_TETNG|nr:unnamed protein product [Tetraodon nigroviridis]